MKKEEEIKALQKPFTLFRWERHSLKVKKLKSGNRCLILGNGLVVDPAQGLRPSPNPRTAFAVDSASIKFFSLRMSKNLLTDYSIIF